MTRPGLVREQTRNDGAARIEEGLRLQRMRADHAAREAEAEAKAAAHTLGLEAALRRQTEGPPDALLDGLASSQDAAGPEAGAMIPLPPEAQAPATAKATAGLPPPTLNANAPFDTAKVFAERQCKVDGALTVWFWQGQFWRWNGQFYSPEPDEVMRGAVYSFLDGAMKWTGQHLSVRFQPTPRHVNEVLDCLKTGLALGVECQPPMWLDSRKVGDRVDRVPQWDRERVDGGGAAPDASAMGA